jgi:hypothetical protein
MQEKPYWINLDTITLRDMLNRFYNEVKDSGDERIRQRFADLWDLKENALVDKQSSVSVPSAWLQDIGQETA